MSQFIFPRSNADYSNYLQHKPKTVRRFNILRNKDYDKAQKNGNSFNIKHQICSHEKHQPRNDRQNLINKTLQLIRAKSKHSNQSPETHSPITKSLLLHQHEARHHNKSQLSEKWVKKRQEEYGCRSMELKQRVVEQTSNREYFQRVFTCHGRAGMRNSSSGGKQTPMSLCLSQHLTNEARSHNTRHHESQKKWQKTSVFRARPNTSSNKKQPKMLELLQPW